MLSSTIITLIILLTALAAPTAAENAVNGIDTADSAAVIVDSAAADSSRKLLRGERLAAYGVMPPDSAAPFDQRSLDRADLFRGDGTGLSEAMRYRALTSVYVPFTLSSTMNRSLHYGNVAHGWHPSPVSAPTLPFYYLPRAMHGSDMLSASQASGVMIDPLDGYQYTPYPDRLVSPELHILWENGVFGQNTLNLRISRPLGTNLMLSVFSDYNYSERTRFDHEGNDIVNFYNFFRSDTSTIMNHGYNPAAEEHMLGGAVTRRGADSSTFRAAFTYAGLQNEYALNIPADSIHRLNWALLDRGSIRIDAALLDKKAGPLRTSLKTALITESVESIYEPDSTVANGKRGASTFMADADVTLPFGPGVRLQGIAGEIESFESDKIRYTEYYPEIFYRSGLLPPNHPLGSLNLNTYVGMEIVPQHEGDTIFVSGPRYGASLEYRPTPKSRLNLYARAFQDFFQAIGAEGQIETKYAGLLLGYQYTDAIYAAKYVWPEGAPPYAQSANTFIIAPWTARFGGFSLLSRAIITDEKPYLKTAVKLSHMIIPKGMAHSFETELGFDYWSEREPTVFAGLEEYTWNDPIFDVNLKITAHIKSFRLFYKVDNLLNMRQAYVPGYFSPGLTFRWGINWFLM